MTTLDSYDAYNMKYPYDRFCVIQFIWEYAISVNCEYVKSCLSSYPISLDRYNPPRRDLSFLINDIILSGDTGIKVVDLIKNHMIKQGYVAITLNGVDYGVNELGKYIDELDQRVRFK